ncbi:MAG: 50S ribosomal protein L6 [Patescibacteria group bacterium]
MSRIGKMPVTIPDKVMVEVSDQTVKVRGPKGELIRTFTKDVAVTVKDNTIFITPKSEEVSAYWGLTRALLANMVLGVNKGFKKELEIVGVGYRASKKGNDLVFSVGYSNPIEFKAPQGIVLNVDENVRIVVEGCDKDLVGLTAAKIRAIRKPEPYKGKGIKYKDEVVRRKAGKAAGKVAA